MADLVDALSVFAAARQPARRDRLALQSRGEELTFAELAARVASARATLARMGVDRGRRVALSGASDLATVVVLLAIAELRAIAVLLHPRLTEGEAAALVHASRSDVVLDHDALADLATLDPRAVVPEPIAGDVEDPFAIVFTSGTSGSPKGAVLSRRAFIQSAVASGHNLAFGPGDRWLSSLPLAHVGGLGVVTKVLVSGGAAVLEPKFDPDAVLGCIARGGATLLSAVPTTLDALLERDRDGVLARLRAVLVGGAPASPALLARCADRRVLALATYGLTEACSQVTTQAPRDPHVVELGAGRALPGTGVTIRRENGSICDIAEVGRIALRGPTLMTGYDAGPTRAPDAALDGDGWFDTGDVGELDETGRLFVHARRTDLILTGGENVYPAEVERALEAEPGVRRALVFGVPDPRWGQLVAAAIEIDAARLADAIAAASAQLAPHKRPRLAAAVDRIALGATGKVDRRGARQRYAASLAAVASSRR